MTRTSLITIVTALALAACHTSEVNPEPATNGGDPPAELPAQPTRFQIELAGTACFGDCPTYKMDIDQDGNVRFVGRECSARPGVFTQKVAPEDARSIYEALAATHYASLHDSYDSEEAGCELVTDMPTYLWNVQADGQTKPLKRYAGCEGVEELADVDAVMPILHERSDVRRFLRPQVSYCGDQDALVVDTSLRLSLGGGAVALVKVSKKHDHAGSFVIEDCAGQTLASGELLIESRRWLLIDEREQPIALPGDLGEAGSLVIGRKPVDSARWQSPFETTAVRALRVDDELDFSFEQAASCAD